MARRKLSRHQQERIGAIQERRRKRVEAQAGKALEELTEGEPAAGLVVTRHGQNLVVRDPAGALHHCLFRRNIEHLVCGDRVVWQATEPGHGVVTALLPRSSALLRPNCGGRMKPLAANVSQLVVVLAPQPPPSEYLLDQYLVTAENIGVKALIAVNKSDLLEGDAAAEFDQRFGCYHDIGYPVIGISAKFEHGLDPLIQRLQGETSILVGQSGAGKSSLVKALLPDRRIQIGQLSQASGLGRHTTSTTTLYQLPQGGYLIDSPGVRSFRLGHLERKQLERGFREFAPFLGRCRFSDCSHHREPDCALTQAVAAGNISAGRMRNFLHMAAALAADR